MDEQKIIGEIIEREGSEYTYHPSDRGGPTKYGITQRTLSAHLGYAASPSMVRELSLALAREIYAQRYIQAPGFARLTKGRVRGFLIDSGVNHGPGDPIAWLQEIVDVEADGILGPATARAANSYLLQDRLFERLVAKRIVHYGRLISDDPTQAEFAHGWMNRVAGFLEESGGEG
ncbi:MAG: hypothetical protein L0H63_11755 [Nitrococcus sp.]|nr:hypothetical protein [Nitrococcus sp.]